MIELSVATDGASWGNPGIGAGHFAVFKDDKIIYEQDNFYGSVTNNHSELLTIFNAINYLQNSKYNTPEYTITLHSDSQLNINLLTNKFSSAKYVNKESVFIIQKMIRQLKCDFQLEFNPRETRSISYCDKKAREYLKKLNVFN